MATDTKKAQHSVREEERHTVRLQFTLYNTSNVTNSTVLDIHHLWICICEIQIHCLEVAMFSREEKAIVLLASEGEFGDLGYCLLAFVNCHVSIDDGTSSIQ